MRALPLRYSQEGQGCIMLFCRCCCDASAILSCNSVDDWAAVLRRQQTVPMLLSSCQCSCQLQHAFSKIDLQMLAGSTAALPVT